LKIEVTEEIKYEKEKKDFLKMQNELIKEHKFSFWLFKIIKFFKG
jgi:hypothetical protein